MARTNNKIRIIMVGGHHTTALALIPKLGKELEEIGYQLHLYWVGHRFSMRGDKNESLEYLEVTSLKIPFFELNTPKFYKNSLAAVFFGLIFGIARAMKILVKARPHMVISFGGYLAVPVVLAAWVLRVPCVTHEQTAAAGFANRLVSFFCKKVFISFMSSAGYFPRRKTILTGNPLREDIRIDRGLFKFNNEKKTVYVTGGKQGAHRMNKLVKESLPQLLEKYNVIHQCGSVSLHRDFEELIRYRENIRPDLKHCYEIQQHFGHAEVGSVFARADYVVSRAVANIVCELAELKKRAVLIPLPESSHGEQTNNAKLLEKTGLGVVLEEAVATPETLMKSLLEVGEQPINTNLLLKEFPSSSSDKLAKEITAILCI